MPQALSGLGHVAPLAGSDGTGRMPSEILLLTSSA